MALTKTVTKVFPSGGKVGIHLKLEDDSRPVAEQTVINRDFVDGFVPGQGMLNNARDAIGKAAQEAIDEYLSNKQTYNASAYDTAVSQIDNALNITE